MLQGKKILLGITGSIAAYKAALLCRLLIKDGAEVRVIMTEASRDFISGLTFSTLTGHPVMDQISDGDHWNNHVDLGMWADVMLIAPATANSISKMAHGLADNMLSACYLSAKCPVIIAPAMDLDMWKHPSTAHNLSQLVSYGNKIIPVGTGYLASGLEGEGRMAEPEEIVTYLNRFFKIKADLAGKKVLITLGPTFESIDPVRFIGNRSSGKMGAALAEVCLARGADVTVVAGPVSVTLPAEKYKIIHVQCAQEMYKATSIHFESSDLVILAAAVADYTVSNPSEFKIKKTEDDLQLQLVKTVDIAATLGKIKRNDQCLIGFALETNDEITHATQKLHKKNLDFIVLNSLSDDGAGFKFDTNKITILDRNGKVTDFA
ncbi:MAG: bifunctional phosphopantothenoylcysteine decarboxylase/phosphopantothenate--cysteine ligase CoaBC, partial [Saprospiraceae bacterium]|nr:bifunctional phosphopantothenoylcysteine decarboxylase/phosphopantothenate--cysteine ligase CoaBC [Saprospiraceae bacterium]